ncbi:MAG: NAD-dependent epimerase/dehydratase family protein [Christensenellales bacterium]
MAMYNVFLTGATNAMGIWCLNRLLKDIDRQTITILEQATEANYQKLEPFSDISELTVRWGDLTSYEDIKACVQKADIILHVGALDPSAANRHPEQAMRVNYGSTQNIIRAIYESGGEHSKKLVYLSAAEGMGDRRLPIHWGRVGDPIKPSIYDYYAVSKVAAERAVIESGLTYWVCLRHAGIVAPILGKANDPMLFYNGLDNAFEYLSDRDSGTALQHLCVHDRENRLPNAFWGHIYNLGGGSSCRTTTRDIYSALFRIRGIKNLANCIDPKWYATRNFHGHYYLDSDKLERHLRFRKDSMQVYYDDYVDMLGNQAKATRVLGKLPFGEKVLGSTLKNKFLKLARMPYGTLHFIEKNMQDHIAAYWGSKDAWEAIPAISASSPSADDWDTVAPIHHGYDESQPESALDLPAMQRAAEFRGGVCLSATMQTGSWNKQLRFRCAFGHEFSASPRLVLEGGHWCDRCERESWNYHERARRDPFFAQVWTPLYGQDEQPRVYPKAVSEADVQ